MYLIFQLKKDMVTVTKYNNEEMRDFFFLLLKALKYNFSQNPLFSSQPVNYFLFHYKLRNAVENHECDKKRMKWISGVAERSDYQVFTVSHTLYKSLERTGGDQIPGNSRGHRGSYQIGIPVASSSQFSDSQALNPSIVAISTENFH